MSHELEVKEVGLEEIYTVFRLIPEFDPLEDPSIFSQRISSHFFIALIAYSSGVPVGFKLGYAKSSTIFYSWLGGVLPEFRRIGIASLLADVMEAKASAEGYQKLVFKTRNCFKEMLIFGLKRGYQVVGWEERNEVSQHRILLEKRLP
jgi:GNAT superfamily N-acetyltransferase